MYASSSYTHTLEHHALKLQERGLKVEEWGKRIQEHGDPLALEYGQFIEECGQLVQQKAEESLVGCRQVIEQEDYSSPLIMLIADTQSEARAAFIQATVVYVQMLKKRTKLVGKHL